MLTSRLILIVIFSLYSTFCYPLLKIDINKGSVNPIPVALAPFDADSWKSKEIAFDMLEIISNNLSTSGAFDILDKASLLEELGIDSVPNFTLWRKTRVAGVIAGSITELGDNRFSIKFKIWSPYGEKVIDGMAYEIDRHMWRRVAHKISNRIYEKMTGVRGYFNTKILFVSEQRDDAGHMIKKLAIMDQDGENFQTITDGKNMVLFPRFNSAAETGSGPQKVIYMSYRGNSQQPGIYVLDLLSKYQYLVKNLGGVSFSPRFTTDGEGALMSASDGKSTNIYYLNLLNGETTRLTHCIGCISTSPSCSPDNKCSKIAFTSDISGSRQIYIMNNDGSGATKISSGDGAYSAPVWSPVDDYIAFVKVLKGNFYIGVMKSDGTGEKLITSSWLDESPSWAPNGKTIIFRRQRPDGTSKLYAIDMNGYNERVIKTPFGASGPSWSANMD
ncbi:Protein TolB [Candidatus Cyrtobacter comes]|uniref:Protein TolB n=1 Tax=Candidatus Cyrtobacter comes TaxID=675776 RepID=A0ABU5L9T3_9RICK|nr:Tol-Pal system protein TolB [Candidatus Cyrtobacter comes]MDZ5762680.1 Protein TolB [Candidatus Cyrtobacter comes]